MSKKVIITGVTGQAGSLMADYLLKNTDYEIYGMVRRLSVTNHKNIEHLKNNPRFHIFSGDLTDGHSLQKSIEEIRPDYYISAGAQSFVAESWISPVNTFITDSVSIIYILEAIKKFVPNCRFINFASSEMFGDVQYTPQDIKHPFRSRSVYAAAKVAAHQIVKVYRESYHLYCLSATCFNYEGKNRGIEFISRKISDGVARIHKAIKNNSPFEPIRCGNINAERDWSDAEDVVDGIWRMLNQDAYNQNIEEHIHAAWNLDTYDEVERKSLVPRLNEYVLASGKTHSVRTFIELAFKEAGIQGVWRKIDGSNEPEKECYVKIPETGNPAAIISDDDPDILVRIDTKFYRPAEVSLLCGNSTPIRQELGWSPKTSFPELVRKMVLHDIAIHS